MRVAYLASPVTLPGSPIRRPDAWEHDQMMAALGPAFAEHGMQVEDISWDDTAADWRAFEAVLIGTTWDYWDRHDAFLDALARIEAATRLFNPLALVRWNSDKRYLADLQARGAPLVPTVWLDQADKAAAETVFDVLASDRLVFKRQVGAGAVDQHLLTRGETIPAMPRPMLAQPFLETIQSEGEFSFVFIDGALSHALVKRAAPGDYRIQSAYGGVEAAITPTAGDLEAARSVLAALETPPLYARIDMVRGAGGALLLMEMELIEPFLYPRQGPDLGHHLASALAKRLGTC